MTCGHDPPMFTAEIALRPLIPVEAMCQPDVSP